MINVPQLVSSTQAFDIVSLIIHDIGIMLLLVELIVSILLEYQQTQATQM
jgi:hypothetical protein